MVTPFLFGRTIAFFREKMLERGLRDLQHLLSFSLAGISLAMLSGIEKDTPINRGGTPKHMPYPLLLCNAILSAEMEKGVSAISKSVRIKYLEFLAETGMTRYEFSKRSGIPESTLWSLGQKEDYDVRESNIRKIAQGMGVPPSELFGDEDNAICLCEKSEVWLVKNFRRLSERQKGCVEGYIKALTEEN